MHKTTQENTRVNIFVASDIEGVAGVVRPEQTGRDGIVSEYETARRLLTNEVNAVVAACKEAGVDRVVVNDGHGSGCNFLVEHLHPAGEYVIGSNRKRSMEGLERGFDGVILLGYHARAGTQNAVLDHTQSSTDWAGYWLSGAELGEIGQLTTLAGHLDVPVILVTGDAAACHEAKTLLPHVETVAVKEAYSRTRARILPPSAALPLIQEGVKRAIKNISTMKPYKITFPATVRIELKSTAAADGYEKSGWSRVGATTVEKTVTDPGQQSYLRIY